MSSTRSLALTRYAAAPAFFLLLGTAAGFLNGLLGTGGGIVIVYALGRALQKHRHRADDRRDVYATALSVMLPISAFSAVRYALGGSLDPVAFAPMLLPTVAGGLLGGILLDRLDLAHLKRLFGLLVLVSGILMIVRA